MSKSQNDILLERAYAVIANAGGGNWRLESEEWQRAAYSWRDQYFAYLGSPVEMEKVAGPRGLGRT